MIVTNCQKCRLNSNLTINKYLINTLILLLQVVTGGQYDVDVVLENPKQEAIYKQIKTQFDSHQFTTTVSSVIIDIVTFCIRDMFN